MSVLHLCLVSDNPERKQFCNCRIRFPHFPSKLSPTSCLLSICVTVLLDPLANVTVSSTGQQGQLNVSWVPPPVKYMDDSMMYEVYYAKTDSHVGQVWCQYFRSRVKAWSSRLEDWGTHGFH